MRAQFGNRFNKNKLKNRNKTVKKLYKDEKVFINLSGFGWNDELKMVTANRGRGMSTLR